MPTRNDLRNVAIVAHVDHGKTGQASLTRPADGTSPDSPDLAPLVKTLLETIPAPEYDAEEPLRAQVTNLDASPFLGRLALLRIHNGWIKKGQQVAWCKHDGTIERVKLTELLGTEALTRVPIDTAGPGGVSRHGGTASVRRWGRGPGRGLEESIEPGPTHPHRR